MEVETRVTAMETYSFDGKRRKDHEESHDSPVVVSMPTFTLTIPDSIGDETCKDDMYNYNVCLTRYGLLRKEFYDAIKEGDGSRILMSWKFLLMHFTADNKGSTKYALEALYLILQVKSVLSPRQAHRLMWNRSVKGNYSNVPLDLEHDNKMVKEAVKKLNGNITEKSVNKIVKSEAIARGMLESFDRTMHIMRRSGKHLVRSDEKDFNKISKLEEESLIKKENRMYTHYNGCNSSLLSTLDLHKMHGWINEHKKKIHKNQLCTR